MNEWMNKYKMDGWINGRRTGGRTNEHANGRADGQTYGHANKRTNERTERACKLTDESTDERASEGMDGRASVCADWQKYERAYELLDISFASYYDTKLQIEPKISVTEIIFLKRVRYITFGLPLAPI